VFALYLLIDGIVMRGVHNSASARPFAEQIRKTYPLNDVNTYVMNDLKEYTNLYGLNFYMKNSFHNFEKERPATGYFLIGEKDAHKALARYAGSYVFTPLATTETEIDDVRQKICLYSFVRN
jgi:hypothetical protein